MQAYAQAHEDDSSRCDLLPDSPHVCYRTGRGPSARGRQESEAAYASSIMADVKRTMAVQRQALQGQRTADPATLTAPPGLSRAGHVGTAAMAMARSQSAGPVSCTPAVSAAHDSLVRQLRHVSLPQLVFQGQC